MRRIISSVLLVAISALLIQCTDKDGRTPRNLLPLSVAAPGEIFVSMDSTQWRGPIGEEIRKLLMAEVEGLPREENLFTLRFIPPQNMSSTLRQVSNIIYVTTFDVKTYDARIVQGYFPKESRDKIMSNENYFLTTAKDVYAREQEIMYLFGQTEDLLVKNLQENGQRIIDHFNRIERQRIESELFSKLEKGIAKAVFEKMEVQIKIPLGFQLAQLEENFAWIVRQEEDVDRHILISYTDYYDVAQFETDSIIKRRDYLGKKYVYEDKIESPSSFMITETNIPYIPVKSRQVNHNGKYAVETRGLWKTNNNTMGGPFIGISVVDERKNRLYYIEGFLYSPGKSQREFIRELEAILYTFKTSQDLVG